MELPVIEGVDNEIILGTALGDAHLCRPKRGRKYNISWEHSRLQEEYALWKAVASGIEFSIYRRDRFDLRTKKTYKSIHIYSISKMDFRDIYNLVYKNGRKEIDIEVLNMLTPLSISVWFCDDGNLYYSGKCCQLTLATDSFRNSEEIIDYFKNRWNLNFKKVQKRIRITGVTEVVKFESLFKKYYPSMMKYKTLSFVKKKYDDTLTDRQKSCRENKYKETICEL